MSTYLWKVTANKSHNQVKPGMMVELVVKDNTGRPHVKEIKEALESKYKIKVTDGIPEGTFDFVKS